MRYEGRHCYAGDGLYWTFYYTPNCAGVPGPTLARLRWCARGAGGGDQRGGLCFASGRNTALKHIAVLGDYGGELQEASMPIEGSNQSHLGRALRRWTGRCLAAGLPPPDGLVPVLLNSARLRERRVESKP